MPLVPYIAFAWAAPFTALPYVAPMTWFSAPSNPAIVIRDVKPMPDGENVMFLYHSPTIIWNNPEDRCKNVAGEFLPFQSPWIDHGATHAAEFFDDFWPRFRDA